MSGGKTKSRSTSSTTQTLNPWSQGQWQTQFDRVQGMLNDNPTQAYTGPLTAGLSDRETQARGMYTANMGSFNPAFDQATDGLNNAGLQADFGAVADQYMNPYEQQVIDATLADITRQNEEQNSRARGRAAASGAYGGSGVAVAEALNNEAAQRLAASTGANLRYTGYNDARGYYGQDIAARERRALGTADLATRRHGLNTQDILGLDALGAVDRGITQAGYDANYAEWLRQQDEQMRRVGIQTGLLGTIPMLTNSTGTSNSVQSTNPGAMGILGAGLGVASMFAPGGGFAGLFTRGAAGAAAHAGSNPTPSDMSVKTDIEAAGTRGGHNWYRFRYVWDDPGTVREGVMAQEVRETRPDAVVERDGILMVDYEALGV